MSRRDGRRHDLSGMDFLNALDDDELSLLEAVGHDDVRALLAAGGDAPVLDFFRVGDHHDVAPGLVELDRGLRTDQRRVWRFALDDDADDAAGDQDAVRIRQLRPHHDGIGVRLDLDIEEVSQAGMRIYGAVGQLDVYGYVRVLVGRGRDPVLIFDDVGFARLERHVDRILAHDRCQSSRRRADEIADGKIGEPNAPVDRRADLRVAEIDLRLLEQRLRLQHIGLGGLLGRFLLIDGGLWHVLILHQHLAALQLQIGVDFCCSRLGKIGVLLVDRRLVGVLLDTKQQVAGLDLLAFGEVALLDETGDPSDDVDLVDRHDAADEATAGVGHLTACHRAYGDGWGRSALRGGCAGVNHEYERTNCSSFAIELIAAMHRAHSPTVGFEYNPSWVGFLAAS